MTAHLRANLLLLVLTLAICAGLYPLSLLAVAQVVPGSDGSFVAGPDGRPVGSRLIAQEFKGDAWFWPRPSAVGYNAAGSGGSNLSASNPKLKERVVEELKRHPGGVTVPADAVMTSGSGLDPHITLANAKLQAGRVAAVRKQDRAAIDDVLNAAAFEPLGGLVGGEPLVNVLEVNLEVAKRFPGK